MDNIEKTISVVKDRSGDLMSAAPSNADTGQIVDEVDGVHRRYERLKAMVGDRRNQLELGSQEVKAFQVVKQQNVLLSLSARISTGQ